MIFYHVFHDTSFNLGMLLYTLNILISLSCIYFIPNVLHWITGYTGRSVTFIVADFKFDVLYLSITISSAIINIIRIIGNLLYFIFSNANDYQWIYITSFCIVLEVTATIICITKSTCRIFGTTKQKIIQTFAISQIFLFLHFVGSNLIVAIPFIAAVPAQALTTVAFLYSAMLSFVLYVYYNLILLKRIKCSRPTRQCWRNCCKPLCQMFAALIFYGGVIIFLTFLTLFFNELAEHGLESSGFGSVLLSFTPPALLSSSSH